MAHHKSKPLTMPVFLPELPMKRCLRCLHRRSAGFQPAVSPTCRRQPPASSKPGSATAWAAGRIYVTGRDGTTVVLRHDRENATLAINRLDDTFSASPALMDRELYLRGERFLYCIVEPDQQ